MNRTLVELEEIVRRRVCGVCSERTEQGNCGLEQPSECALFRLFPLVAQAVQSVSSNEIEPYLAAIRANVCTICFDQDRSGVCEKRDRVRCSLDAYLPLVVDAIEEATGKVFRRPACCVR